MNQHTPTRYITLDQLCDMLGGRSRSSLYRDLANGDIPTPIQIGSRKYWCEEEVHQFLKARRKVA
jgi:predicted DNA-binding transcriptional regulator AlpA